MAELEADYAAMRPMIFGEAPAFDDIMETTRDLEDLINGKAAD